MDREEREAFRHYTEKALVQLQAEFDSMDAEFRRLRPAIHFLHERGASATRAALEDPALREELGVQTLDRLAEMMAGYLVCLQGIAKLQWMLDEYGGPGR
jgi:hypothetical protein